MSKYDSAMFVWKKEKRLDGILVIHVDDFAYAGNTQWIEQVIDTFKQKFKISAQAHGCFKYIGLNVHQDDTGITVDQKKYVSSLKTASLSNERLRDKDAPLTEEDKSIHRSLSGHLLWVTSQTRPDMAYDSCVISNAGKQPTVRKIAEANKAIKKLQQRDEVKLRFPKLGKIEDLKIICYTDATHASLPSGESQGAYIVFLAGGGKVAPVTWQSKKLHRVTKSPLASETLALGEGADAGHLIASMLKEIFPLSNLPTVSCFTDNMSLRDALHTTHIVDDMRLRVDIARLRESIELKEITVDWVNKEAQLADALTKKNASADELLKVLCEAALRC